MKARMVAILYDPKVPKAKKVQLTSLAHAEMVDAFDTLKTRTTEEHEKEVAAMQMRMINGGTQPDDLWGLVGGGDEEESKPDEPKKQAIEDAAEPSSKKRKIDEVVDSVKALIGM